MSDQRRVHAGRATTLRKIEEVVPHMDQLLEEEANTRNMVTEKVFMDVFLPQLVDKEKFDINTWYSLPAGPAKPLEVYDTATGTELLFEVPALHRSTDPYSNVNINIAKAMEDAAIRAEVDHRFGDEKLNQIAGQFKNTPQDLTALVTMNNIFRRYGYPEIPLPEGVTLPEASVADGKEEESLNDDTFTEL